MTAQTINGFRRPTREESLNKILAYANDPKKYFVESAYSDGKGCRCAVGVLFSPAQLRDIWHRDLGEADVFSLAESIGTDNIEFVTGLKVAELMMLQECSDNGWLPNQQPAPSRKAAVRAAVAQLRKSKSSKKNKELHDGN